VSIPHRATCRRAGALAVWWLFAFTPAAEAQDARLLVRVTSDAGPVPGAEVSAAAGDGAPAARAFTDARGEAVLGLRAGEYLLGVVALGYAEARREVVLRPRADTTVVVALEPAPIETRGIFVLSTRSERRIEDEPLRVEVVSREEVEEKLMMTPGDIAMLLNETAGLRVQPTQPSLGGASVRIQGMRGRYTQILSDGLPLYGGQTGALGPLQIPPMDLGQVEVIKGAASALYGTTALGGVVNLISRRPEREREALFNQTTLGGTDAVLWLAGEPTGRWAYTLLAGGHRQARADVDRDGWADVPAFRRMLARPRLFWDDGRGRSAFATVGATIEDRKGGTLPGSVTPAGTPHSEELATRRLDAGIVGRALLGQRRLLALRASAMTQWQRHALGPSLERERHATAFAEAALSGTDGGHAWVIGAAVQHDRYRGRDVPHFDFAHTVPALFAQDEVSLAPWLMLAASARLDVHSQYGASAAPRVSALFRPGAWAIRASGGGGYFAPTPFTEETEAVGLGRLLPFGDLEVERAWSGMLDVGRVLGPWEFNATLFGSRIRDPLQARPAPGGGLSLSNVDGPVRTWGVELLARYERERLHANATYVHTRATEPRPDGLGRREVPLTPRHTVGLVAALEDEERGRIGGELYYTGRQELDENPYRPRSRPYLVLGFLAEARFGRARVFVNAENVLDSRQTGFDPLVLPAQSPDGRWITDVWAPVEGRVLNAGVRFAF
jgi:iron complex outermembrane receptor protein